MKPQDEKQTLAKARGQAKKPRFRIEPLEQRIAPHAPKIFGPHDHGNKCRGHNCWRP